MESAMPVAIMGPELTDPQRRALAHVKAYARSRRSGARTTIDHVLRMSNVDRATWLAALEAVRRQARVALHFHPDRVARGASTVAEGLLELGRYASQFETGISNGMVDPRPDGARAAWEDALFGDAYEDAEPTERPTYGALDLLPSSDGPSPRFGSCYFLLAPEVTRRSTFTYLDSHLHRAERGTLEQPDDVLASLLLESFERRYALGHHGTTPPRLVTRLRESPDPSFRARTQHLPTRNLDHYVEAQVHGEVALRRDVEALVADPSFRGHETGRVLEALCARYDIALCWHRGSRMGVDDVPPDFRGPTMPSLAERVAADGSIDARLIGVAASSVARAPELWADRGTGPEVIQELKLLWHCLLRFGHPVSVPASASCDVPTRR